MTKKNLNLFIDWCIKEHRFVNQKYDKKFEYYTHLAMVATNIQLFRSQLKWVARGQFEDLAFIDFETIVLLVTAGAWGHDLLEDTNNTYNDVREALMGECGLDNYHATIVCEIIFACTESTGRNRAERHDEAFLKRLTEYPLGTFLKLIDIFTNVTYGLATGSGMYFKYKEEFGPLREYLSEFEFTQPLESLMDAIEDILKIKQKK